jgi:methionyl-tRNA synthetase
MINPSTYSAIVFVMMIWSVVLKGIALWRASHSNQRNWFIALMLPINTGGILELVYLFKFAKKPLTVEEIRSWFQKNQKKK